MPLHFVKTNTQPATDQTASGDKKPITHNLLKFLILILIWVIAFSSRLFSIIRFESIIHEFDPWFNYRATHYMVKHGFYNFHNWFDERAWYPLGRIVGGTVYPGLMLTSGLIHFVLDSLHIRSIWYTFEQKNLLIILH